jgi:hypothetical protein
MGSSSEPEPELVAASFSHSLPSGDPVHNALLKKIIRIFLNNNFI